MTETVSTSASKRRKRAKRIYRKHGEIVRVAARISGRSPKTVYAVLNGTCVSAPVQRALNAAREELRQRGRAI